MHLLIRKYLHEASGTGIVEHILSNPCRKHVQNLLLMDSTTTAVIGKFVFAETETIAIEAFSFYIPLWPKVSTNKKPIKYTLNSLSSVLCDFVSPYRALASDKLFQGTTINCWYPTSK